jgi:hypothetical protein
MQDFKEKKAVHVSPSADDKDKVSPVMARLHEEQLGWYEGTIDFKRVQLVPGTGKFQYRDTRFVAQCKAYSGIDCYNRSVEHCASVLTQEVSSLLLKARIFISDILVNVNNCVAI